MTPPDGVEEGGGGVAVPRVEEGGEGGTREGGEKGGDSGEVAFLAGPEEGVIVGEVVGEVEGREAGG